MDEKNGKNLEEIAEESGHPVLAEEAAVTPSYGEIPEEKHKEKQDSFIDTNNDAIATAFAEEMENN